MSRRLACVASFLLFTVAPAAAADGPSYLMAGWTGVTAPDQPLRFVTLPGRSETVLAAVRRSTGRVVQWRPLAGTWGVPMVANDGTAGGLSRDGRLVVIADWTSPGDNGLRATSRFFLVNTKSFYVWRKISLRGDFSFDALSPGGGTLYLIEHLSNAETTRYRVRAYDIAARRLLPRVIADRRQSSWIMNGYPVTRTTSADGRWVYTLYDQPDGFPFVHALDAIEGTAVCIGIPWRGKRDILSLTKLRLDEHAGRLSLETRRGRPLFAVDTHSYWVSRPSAKSAGFPFAAVFAPVGGVAVAALTFRFRRRIRIPALRPLLR